MQQNHAGFHLLCVFIGHSHAGHSDISGHTELALIPVFQIFMFPIAFLTRNAVKQPKKSWCWH
jgi:hypothetical protein